MVDEGGGIFAASTCDIDMVEKLENDVWERMIGLEGIHVVLDRDGIMEEWVYVE